MDILLQARCCACSPDRFLPVRTAVGDSVNRMRSPILFLAALPLPLMAQDAGTAAEPYPADVCPSCAEWNASQPPFRVFGNTYYVGTRGLGAILLTSDEGHVLIDGALPESVPAIIGNIAALGFRIEDVRLILNSHPHFDHAGGIAALQRASGATVAGSALAAPVLERGKSGPDDPQYGVALSFPAIPAVTVFGDGDTLRVGPLAVIAHLTPGHTPGGTSWAWRSCEGGRCISLVYADSQTPVSADDFSFTRSTTYPSAIADFEKGFTELERLHCDILLTPHPDASGLWDRLEARDSGAGGAFVDPEACRRYAATARQRLARRIAVEAEARPRSGARP
jgi:metallo-beta-lactamase class B